MKKPEDDANQPRAFSMNGSFQGALDVATKKKFFTYCRGHGYDEDQQDELAVGMCGENFIHEACQMLGETQSLRKLVGQVIASRQNRHRCDDGKHDLQN